jgi:hypothetical protein
MEAMILNVVRTSNMVIYDNIIYSENNYSFKKKQFSGISKPHLFQTCASTVRQKTGPVLSMSAVQFALEAAGAI